jgi:hypothetical protein
LGNKYTPTQQMPASFTSSIRSSAQYAPQQYPQQFNPQVQQQPQQNFQVKGGINLLTNPNQQQINPNQQVYHFLFSKQLSKTLSISTPMEDLSFDDFRVKNIIILYN